MEGLAGAVVGFVFVGAALLALAAGATAGTLPRNGAVGIRTRATRMSDEAWQAGHRAAAPVLVAGGWLSLVAGAAVVVLLVVDADTAAAIVGAVGGLAVTVSVVVMTVRANRAARAAVGH